MFFLDDFPSKFEPLELLLASKNCVLEFFLLNGLMTVPPFVMTLYTLWDSTLLVAPMPISLPLAYIRFLFMSTLN